jgi:hypothetical protein
MAKKEISQIILNNLVSESPEELKSLGDSSFDE